MARAERRRGHPYRTGDFDIPMYNADLEAHGTPADVIRLKELMYDHPAWIISSPEYNGSYTALLEEHHRLGLEPDQGRPGLDQRQQALPRQGRRHAQRVHWRAGRTALAKPSGPAAAKPAVLVCPQQFALGRAGDAFDERGSSNPTSTARVRMVVDQTLWAAARLAT